MGLRSCDIQLVFFFKQKTAYEMRISDWSSDVCSSDLPLTFDEGNGLVMIGHLHAVERPHEAFHIARQVDVERAPRRANVGIAVERDEAVISQHLMPHILQPLPRLAHAIDGHRRNRLDARVALDLRRSEEHTSELQSLMRISYAVFGMKK